MHVHAVEEQPCLRALPSARQRSAELRHRNHTPHKLGNPDCARQSIGLMCIDVGAMRLRRLLQQ